MIKRHMTVASNIFQDNLPSLSLSRVLTSFVMFLPPRNVKQTKVVKAMYYM